MYQLLGMDYYVYKITAHQLGKCENVSVIREYQLYRVLVRRELTIVCTSGSTFFNLQWSYIWKKKSVPVVTQVTL